MTDQAFSTYTREELYEFLRAYERLMQERDRLLSLLPSCP
jgi:hypothetical protein